MPKADIALELKLFIMKNIPCEFVAKSPMIPPEFVAMSPPSGSEGTWSKYWRLNFGPIARVSKGWNEACSAAQLKTIGGTPRMVIVGGATLLCVQVHRSGVGRFSIYLQHGKEDLPPERFDTPEKRAIRNGLETTPGWHKMHLGSVFDELWHEMNLGSVPDELSDKNRKNNTWKRLREFGNKIGTLQGRGKKKTTLVYYMYKSINDHPTGTLCHPKFLFGINSSNPEREADTYRLLYRCEVMNFCRSLTNMFTLLQSSGELTIIRRMYAYFLDYYAPLIVSAPSHEEPYLLQEFCNDAPPHPVAVVRELPHFDPNHPDWSNDEKWRTIFEEFSLALAPVMITMNDVFQRHYTSTRALVF